MIEYKISFRNPNAHIIEVEALFHDLQQDFFIVNLPAWRPGRYELANYAKNILTFNAFSLDDHGLETSKISKDEWKIVTKRRKSIKINYTYYAFTMDAGGSWLDDEQLYINPINCIMYNKERMYEKCILSLEIPASYQIATGLKYIEQTSFIAKDYYELVDCPIIASPTLKRLEYVINEVEFNIWINGSLNIDDHILIKDFQLFSQYQIRMMGGFPEKDYHFLLQILPHSFRHGVEHRNSTVITIGPSFQSRTHLYQELLGISSHELFHAWNVLKIRPKELLPYDFNRENYFKTGYVAEGLTTYYGDLFLVRSGVYSIDDYLKNFNHLLQRHLETLGNYNMSVADSSFDLWLDGYTAGVPGRKVSIYVKGAVIAFIIDLAIRKISQNQYSLDNVVRDLWEDFGKNQIGYNDVDFRMKVNKYTNNEISALLEKCINGTTDLKPEIEAALGYLGFELAEVRTNNSLESSFGVKCMVDHGKFIVDLIHPQSNAYEILSKGDKILAINNIKFEGFIAMDESVIEVLFFRGNRIRAEKIRKGKDYFSKYLLTQKIKASEQERVNFNLWVNKP